MNLETTLLGALAHALVTIPLAAVQAPLLVANETGHLVLQFAS